MHRGVRRLQRESSQSGMYRLYTCWCSTQAP